MCWHVVWEQRGLGWARERSDSVDGGKQGGGRDQEGLMLGGSRGKRKKK